MRRHLPSPSAPTGRAFLAVLRPERRQLGLALLAFTGKHSPAWLTPLITANLIDIVVAHRPLGDLVSNAVVLLVVLALNVPLHLLYVHWMYGAVRRTGHRLRSQLSTRLQQLSIGYHTRQSAGVLQTKVINDVGNVEQALRQSADTGFAALVTLVGALVVIAVRAPVFLPAFLLVTPAVALLVRRLRLRMGDQNRLARIETEHLSTRVAEMITLVPITRAHALEDTALERVDEALDRQLHGHRKLDLVNGRFSALSWMVFNSVNALCLLAAVSAAYAGVLDVTVGTVVMLGTYFSYLTGAVAGLLGLTPLISKGMESLASLQEVFAEPELELSDGKPAVEAVAGHVEFKGVGYTYPDETRAAVQDVSFSCEPGGITALVGPSGVGKSTVLSLLMGFLRPQEGSILLDGQDLAGIDLRSYRRFLSVVPQESVLFEGTVRENVTYGLPGVSDQAFREALRDANALEFVERLTEGADTVIGDRGARLSGGQKQRLAIARALLRDPKVLILDEATSALDARSEAEVHASLVRLARDRTVLVVAHRLSTIRQADQIVVMDNGRVTEIGTHDGLLARRGTYAGLQAAQLA
ncbi:ABC transporter ATP-binding protein [Streptomyces sp. NPDC059629]|uniref:ABC transporter ATP-binding protein n=1 Tax=Streptomyces sp. NPDC059629 TaxID=3346889 RepID=UPI0036D1D1EE